MIIPVRNVVYFDYHVMKFKVTGFSTCFSNSTLATEFLKGKSL